MARKGYSTVFDAETTAVSRGKDVHCSPKASRNIMLAIKGMRLEEAKVFLDEVTEKKRPLPMLVRKRKIKHRKGAGIGPAAYPVKAADRVLRILTNAENNAEYKDLETENLRIIHASAYRGETIVKFKPRAQGRATARCEQTTNMEIVLGEDERLDERDEAREERREQGSTRPRRGKATTARKSVTAAAAEEKSAPSEAEEAPAETESETGPAPAASEGETSEEKKEES